MHEKLPADEIYKEDGRKSDGKDHKGDWGKHQTKEQQDKVEVRKVKKK